MEFMVFHTKGHEKSKGVPCPSAGRQSEHIDIK